MHQKTNSRVELIVAMRSEGMRYEKIAQLLGLKTTYCRTTYSRANRKSKKAGIIILPNCCHYCGKPLVYTPNAKQKLYCNDHCRNKYHNRKKSTKINVCHCEVCGGLFVCRGAYIKRFCSAECRTEGARRADGNR